MTTTEPKFDSIVALLAASSTAIGVVEKRERNDTGKGFNFRGIDTVVNATSPEFREHGIIVVPESLDRTYEQIEVGEKRTLMGHVMLRVRYTFYGPAGDSIAATVDSEAFDSGDKATAKAMSVALRTALLQVLMLPTDEPDPDATSYERAPSAASAPRSAPKAAKATTDAPATFDDPGAHVVEFGKHKGSTIRDLASDPETAGYVSWMANQDGDKPGFAAAKAYMAGAQGAPDQPADYDDTPTFDENGCPF